jgi:hypothetical protein
VLTLTAAPISAVTAACGSIHHSSRSPAGRPVRREKISAITANLRAPAAFSTRAHPPAASTNSASVSDARSAISGNDPSNMLSNLRNLADQNPHEKSAQPQPVDESPTVDN